MHLHLLTIDDGRFKNNFFISKKKRISLDEILEIRKLGTIINIQYIGITKETTTYELNMAFDEYFVIDGKTFILKDNPSNTCVGCYFRNIACNHVRHRCRNKIYVGVKK